MVRELLRRGAVVTSEEHGKYLLSCAAENKGDIVEMLLRSGVYINWQDRNKETALFKAYQNAHLDMCHLLLEAGADGTLRNAAGLTAEEMMKGQANRDCAFIFARRFSKPQRSFCKTNRVRNRNECHQSQDAATSPLDVYLNHVPKKVDNPPEIFIPPQACCSLVNNHPHFVFGNSFLASSGYLIWSLHSTLCWVTMILVIIKTRDWERRRKEGGKIRRESGPAVE